MKKVYKPAKFIEVGTTYYIRDKHDPEMYYQVEVIKIDGSRVIVKGFGEKFSVFAIDLYTLCHPYTDYYCND